MHVCLGGGGGGDEGEENVNMSRKIGPYKNTRCH